jgi:two-component system sensor histidine kinase RegB
MSAVQQTRTPRVPAKAVPVPVVGVGDSRPAARVRLGALNNLRWLAVIGQSVALLFVRFILNFDFPLALASSVVGASAILNVILMAFFPASKRLSVREATAFLAYDTTQLATLLFLTGGIENPFALMFVGPVVISAATLDVKSTLFLGALTFIAIVLLATNHVPLPWVTENSLQLPPLYQFGIVISLILGIGFASVYAYRIAEEAMRMSAALAATQLALAREHRVAALGGLAAAAAHELGTPLGTIAVVARVGARARGISARRDFACCAPRPIAAGRF